MGVLAHALFIVDPLAGCGVGRYAVGISGSFTE